MNRISRFRLQLLLLTLTLLLGCCTSEANDINAYYERMTFYITIDPIETENFEILVNNKEIISDELIQKKFDRFIDFNILLSFRIYKDELVYYISVSNNHQIYNSKGISINRSENDHIIFKHDGIIKAEISVQDQTDFWNYVLISSNAFKIEKRSDPLIID